jgi:hypothetical protein
VNDGTPTGKPNLGIEETSTKIILLNEDLFVLDRDVGRMPPMQQMKNVKLKQRKMSCALFCLMDVTGKTYRSDDI